MIKKRTSVLTNISILTVSLSSVFQIGDTQHIKPRSRALAVQRYQELFYGDEGSFEKYSLFSTPLPKPECNEYLNIQRNNVNPVIKVHSFQLIGASGSAVVQIGSSQTVDAEARVKHIRQISNHKV